MWAAIQPAEDVQEELQTSVQAARVERRLQAGSVLALPATST